MKNTARWQLTSGMLHGFIGAVQTAYGYTQDLNESLNSIRIVTGQSVEQMDKFAARANEAAKRLSTTTTRYTDAALIYYQQGLSDEEVAGRADVTIKLANAAGEAAETASEQLTAVWNNFYDGTKSLEYYADVMTALGATTASSTQEISQGLQKFAAVADTVGLSYEYAAAALATVMATTRESADIVGTAFRTLFGRLESLKLGETLDDGTTLNKYSQALKSVGVNVKDVNGNLKDMDDILSETMAKWDTLTRDQQMALAQTVAGVRQYSQFIALMDNADFFRTNLETARNATGTLQEQADLYAESWEAARDRVKAAAQDVYESLFNDETFISIDNSIAKILDRVDNMVDTFGGLSGTLTVVFNLMTQIYGNKMAQGIDNIGYNLASVLGINQMLAKDLQNDMINTLKLFGGSSNAQSEEARAAAGAVKDAYKEVIQVQNESTAAIERLGAAERVILEDGMQRIGELKDKMIELQTDVESFASSVEDAGYKITAVIQKSVADTDQYSKVDNIRAGWNSLTEAQQQYYAGLVVSSRETSSFYQDLANVSLNWKPTGDFTKNFTAEIGILRDRYLELTKQIDTNSVQIDNWTKELSKASDNTSGLETQIRHLSARNKTLIDEQKILKSVFETFAKQSQDSKQALKDLENAINQVSEDYNNLRNANRDFTSTSENFKAAIEGQREALKKLDISVMTLGQRLTNVASGLSALYMGFNALKSIGRVFSDEDMSNADRLTTLLMSGAMLLNTFNNGLNLLSKRQGTAALATVLANKAEEEQIILKSSNTVTTKAATIATEIYEKSLLKAKQAAVEHGLAKSIESAAISEATKAQLAASAAVQGYLAVLSPAIGIIAGIVAVLYTATLAYNADAIAAENAASANEKATNAATKAKDAYQSLVNSIKDYEKAVSAIDGLTKGTEEYTAAVEEANEKARKLLDINKELRKYARYDSNGLLVIGSSAMDDAKSTSLALANQAEAAKYLSDQANNGAVIQSARTQARRSLGVSGSDFDQAVEAYEQSNRSLYALYGLSFKTNGKSTEEVQRIIDTYLTVVDDGQRDIKYANQEFIRIVAGTQDAFNELEEAEKSALVNILANYGNGINGGEVSKEQQQQALYYGSLLGALVGNSAERQDALDRFATLNGYQLGSGSRKGLSSTYTFYDPASGQMVSVDAKAIQYRLAQDDISQRRSAEIERNIPILNVARERLMASASSIGKEFTGFFSDYLSSGQVDLTQLSPVIAEKLKDALSDENSDIKNALTSLGEGWSETLGEVVNNFSVDEWTQALEDKFIAEGEKGEEARKAAFNALFKIGKGNLLEDADIDLLRQTFASFENLSGLLVGFENLAVTDQIAILQTLAGTSKDSIEAYQEYVDKLRDQLRDMAEGTKEAGELESQIEKAGKELQRMKDEFERNPWKIEFELADGTDIRALAAEVGNVKKAYALVDKERRVSSENLVELAKRYPQALIDADYEAADNTLKISEKTYNELRDLAEDTTESQRDQAARQLLAQAETEAKILQVIEIAEKAKREDRADTLTDAINNNKITEDSANETARRIAIEVLKNEIKNRKEKLETKNKNIKEDKAYEQTFENIQDSVVKIFAASQQAQVQTKADATEKIIKYDTAQETGIVPSGLTTEIKTPDWKSGLSKGKVVSASEVETTPEEDIEVKKLEKEISDLEYILKRIEDGNLRMLDINIHERRGTLPKELADTLRTYINNPLEFIGANVDTEAGTTVGTKSGEAAATIAQLLGQFIAGKENNNRDGSSSSAKTKDKQYERYHEITREIAKQSDLLKEIDTETDRAYGTARLNLYRKSIEALTQQQANYNQKAKEASNYLSGDREELESLNAKYGLGLLFDAKGEIDQYDEFIERMTKKRDNASGVFIDDDYTIVMNAIKRYEEALDTQRENLQLAADTAREIEDQKLNEINYKLEFALDVKEVKKQVNDISKSIAESYGDALTHTLSDRVKGFTGVADLNKANVEIEISKLDDYQQKAKDLDELLASTTDKASIDAIVSEQEDLIDKLGESIDVLLEWVDYWENMVPEALDAANERLAQFTDQLDHNVSILDTIKELYTLQGQTYKTAQGFNRLQQVSREQMDAQLTKALLNKDYFDGIAKELQIAENALKGISETDVRYDALKNNRDALLAQYNEAQAAYLSSANAAMEAARDMYTQQLERAAYDFGEAIAGNGDLDFVNEQYDHFIESEEHYLDEVNKAYQEQLWSRKIMLDYDNATNKAHQDLIKAFEDEKNALFARTEINEYDLEVLEARYKVMQAEIALRDAEGAKNHLQLVRDRQGNWNYQYTSDADDIAKAEQDLADAQNDWYNISRQQTKDVTGEIVKLWKDSQNAVRDILNNMELTEEERNARIEEIQRYYSEKAQALYRDRDQAMADMTEAGKLRLEDYGSKYEQTLADMTGDNVTYQQALNEYIELCKNDMESYQSTIQSVARQSGVSLENLDNSIKAVKDSNDKLKKSGEDAVASMISNISRIHNVALSYQELASSIHNAYNEMVKLATSQGNRISESASITYDKDTDYSGLMSIAYAQKDWSSYRTLYAQRNAKIAGENITNVLSNQEWEEIWKKKYGYGVASAATGMYTGEWGNEGKLAFLHEKELVLNSSDTANILAAVEAIRAIEHGLDNNVAVMMGDLLMRAGGAISPAAISNDNGTVNQYTVYFPGVTDHTEIELALRNLANDADQWSEIKSN